MPRNIRGTMSILDVKDGFSIYFKRDGSRFEMPTTIKLMTLTTYRISLHLNPVPSPVEFIKVNDILTKCHIKTLHEVGNVRIEFLYDSSMVDASKKKTRTYFTLEVFFEDNTSLQIVLQVKFYNKMDVHLFWGTQLNYVLMAIKPLRSSLGYEILDMDCF